jgi:hypothetical protein|uniref:hypothetical protein n=1 Tax=Candidatus Nanopelagicus sp. TaxID=2518620 RepID=UPI00404AFAE2
MKIKLIATSLLVLSIFAGVLGLEKYISSQIASGVKREMPNASGVSASIPLTDIASNITSDSIKLANIDIEKYPLKESNTDSSIKIEAGNISKSKPTLIGSLEITATIPVSTIAKASEFGDAQIVGNTLQVAAGAGGLGKASLIPKYSNNQLYFELKSVSLFGNDIPASSLPADLQTQIKSKSQRTLTPPKGLKVKSVSLSSKGLSVKMSGSNVQLGNLGL